MRFKISFNKEPKHSELASCIGWCSTTDVYSCADDHQIICWNLLNDTTQVVTKLAPDVYPTDMHWCPRTPGVSAGSKKHPSGDIFVITAADGKFHLISKSGRIEKSVDAHRGAVLVARWSHDGMALVSGGEDGQVKIWSRTGMLRSTLAQTGNPVYCLAWGPDSSEVVYASGKSLIIKPLQPNNKPLQWLAHDGIILKVAWSMNNNLILSGGEDCKYKLWDCYGRQMYCSTHQESPVTALAWSPDGELFAVGAFNTVRLCDKIGWSHSLEKPNIGSVFNLSWSADSTQVVGACGSGHVIFAHVVDRRLEWKCLEAVVSGRKRITVYNVADDSWEKLEFRDRIIKISLGYNHLVVATSTQCHIYSTKNWNTPIIFELKEGSVTCLVLAEKHFLLVDSTNVGIYSYEGRLLSNPRWPGMRPDVINPLVISISNDRLAVRDKADEKVVYIMDTLNGKHIGDGKPFTHKLDIVMIGLDQQGPANERLLAFIDKNRDLYLQEVKTGSRSIKITVMAHALSWNDEANMLAALQEGTVTVWFNPSAAYVDRNLLCRSLLEKETSDLGQMPQIVSFMGDQVNIRRSDGSLVVVAIPPYPKVLRSYVDTSRWDDAIRLCRFIKDESLWSCLAAFAIQARELNTAGISYAALNEASKVEYIERVKNIQVKEARLAQMALLCNNSHDAEAILLQAGLALWAIMMNIRLSNWERYDRGILRAEGIGICC